MLFQGQEFSASAPFLYFADFDAELAAAVRLGRSEFLTQFPSIVEAVQRGVIADPGAPETFERCRIDLRERESHAAAYALHVDLLRIRREGAAWSAAPAGGVDGAVLSASAFALRFFTPDHGDDRLLVVNVGADMQRGSFAEPLLAPCPDTDWALCWSSEDPSYGGGGTADPFPDNWWHIPGESALLFGPGPRRPRRPLPLVARGRP
jgi:maltooligosyltrehalose trehalohydrolase